MKLLENYSDKVKNHKIYLENKKEIEQFGIDNFLRGNGVFVEVLPLLALPIEEGIIKSINYEIEYWTNKKDEEHWNMGFYESENLPQEEISDSAILKGFEFIEVRLNG